MFIAHKSLQSAFKIFNTLGEEIETLVNEEKTFGNYNVEFNANKLPFLSAKSREVC